MNSLESMQLRTFPKRLMNPTCKACLSLLTIFLTPAFVSAGDIRFEGNAAQSSAALGSIEVKLVEQSGQLLALGNGDTYRLDQLDTNKLTSEAVAEIVRAISRHYQAEGILATRAQVTRSSFEAAKEGGDLVIQVIEGRVGEVRVVGADGESVSERTREQLLATSPVQVGSAIDGRELEHSVTSINRFAAGQIQPVLFSEPEGIVLQYRVKQDDPWDFGYTVDNFGSERTGEVRHSLDARFVGLGTLNDRLNFSAIVTSTGDSQYFRGEYFLPLGRTLSHRFRLSSYYASYTAETVGNTAFDYEGESLGAVFSYEATLWSGDSRFLDFNVGLHAMNASQDQSSVGLPEADSDFLLPFVELKLSQKKRNFSWISGVRIESNLPSLAGTDSELELQWLGRYQVNDSFTILRIYGGLRTYFDENRLHEGFMNGAYVGVLGHDRLPAPFLNVVGGHATVRGYPVALLSGDRSATAQIEYRYHLLRNLQPQATWDLSLAGFLDIGAVENEEASSPLPYEYDDTLSSYGFGLHAVFRNGFNLSLEYAFAADAVVIPYSTKSVESGDGEAYFKGSFRF